jgi:hypothetical protein
MIKRFLLLALMLLTLAGTAEAQLGTVPNTFIEGVNIIDDLNENFSIAYSTALNRTGGTMTGTLTSQGLVPATTATYDFGSGNVHYLRSRLRQRFRSSDQRPASSHVYHSGPASSAV